MQHQAVETYAPQHEVPLITLKAALPLTLSITSGTMRSLARITVVSLIKSEAQVTGASHQGIALGQKAW
jgi:hypothetical protein